ncbi:MAG: hypothetical protein IPI30_22310 [Saprospiraceae bacterium]|nr:hypothetical protein [Candidatus Vicinibacter affinis]
MSTDIDMTVNGQIKKGGSSKVEKVGVLLEQSTMLPLLKTLKESMHLDQSHSWILCSKTWEER